MRISPSPSRQPNRGQVFGCFSQTGGNLISPVCYYAKASISSLVHTSNRFFE